MSRLLRSLVVAFVTSSLILAHAAPALAYDTSVNAMEEQEHAVPVLFDALVLRPVGMIVTGIGATLFCVVAPIMAITRPTDIGKPFRALVIRPFRYTWVDPLGTH